MKECIWIRRAELKSGGIEENKYKYCPYCGKKIKEIKESKL